MSDGRGGNGGTDDAEQALREGYARMAVTAAEVQALPGHDENGRKTFQTYRRMFAASAGVATGTLVVRHIRARRIRRLALSVLLLIGVGTAYTIADSRNPPPETKDWKPTFDPYLAQARGTMPGRPETLALRVYNRRGSRCVVLGKLRNGRVGIQGSGFWELAAGTSPVCLRPGQTVVTPVSNVGGRHPYSVLFGVAERDVHVRVGLKPPGREVLVASDGTFMLASSGLKSLARHKAYITDADGRTTARTLGTGSR